MGVPRAFLLCLFGTVLCPTGSGALQCYSFEHTYTGPFDLSDMKFPSISCPHGCSEVVLSLDTGYRAPVTLVKKGCWTGPTAGSMQSNQDALPPDFSVVRGCVGDFCNNHLVTHDVIPNLSQAPDPQRLSGTECYACVGIHPEDCSPDKSRRVQCHQDQSVCFQGNGRMTTGNFSVPVYIRTCHRPSCTTMGTTSPWTAIDLQGACCEGHLCNRDSVTQAFNTPTAAAPPRVPHIMTLALLAPLLVSSLGGPLWLSI
nr:ly6/PLAUR domain-containing protein 5 [Marmota flaviventris]